MALDASTDASVAALLVAFVALIVTSAQAIQQYLVSGQLIRICDSVVYGKMPGQGRRIWEFSQFRFRVVYSIPQIKLPSSLWSDNPSHSLLDKEGDLTLPDLQISELQSELGLKQAIKKQFDLQMGRTRDLLCGEASWVSFGRAIQHSSGNSLRYEMVDGDADRCPTDLPIVPMQLCMRDVIVLATMTGLECTDVSYQQQSISMQGSAGTITSSRHPILGALVHFAPKLPYEKHGFRTNDGTVNPQWVARMRDIMTVAGQQYSMRDRKHFEEDEGHWVMLSHDRSLVKYQEKSFRGPASVDSDVRRRRGTRGIQGPQSEDLITTDQMEHSTVEVVAYNSNDPMDLSIRRPQDGEWSWSVSSEGSEAEKASAVHEAGYLPLSSSTQAQPAQVSSFRNWHYQLTSFLRRRASATIDLPHYYKKPSVLPVSEPIGYSRQKIQSEAKSVNKQPSTEINNTTFFANPPTRMKSNNPKSNQDGVRGEAFKDRVEPRQIVTNDESYDDSQPTLRRLRLTNKEVKKSQTSSVQLYDWRYTEQEKKLAAAQAEQIGQKWQRIVKKRQELRARRSRKEQDWLRRKSDPRQRENTYQESTAPNSGSHLRIGEFDPARIQSDDNESQFQSDLFGPSRSGSRMRNSIPSPQNTDTRKDIPRKARWTKIHRRLVNPKALAEAHERFEENPDCVIVLRALTREEIEKYALRTQEIRVARKQQENPVLSSELSDLSDVSSFSTGSKNSIEGLQYEAPRKAASPTKNGHAADPHPDQLPDENNSNSFPLKDESQATDFHDVLIESSASELNPRGLGETRSVKHRIPFPNDVINGRSASSLVNLNDGVSQNEKNLPKTRGQEKKLTDNDSLPETASPLDKPQQNFQEAHAKEMKQGKVHGEMVEPQIRRHSSAHTESSNTFSNEILRLSSDSILKKVRERIKQCKDIPVALEHFGKSQTDPQYPIGEVIAIYDQLKHTGVIMKRILIIAKQALERKNLDSRTVSDLEILVANLGDCLGVLESEFELFEITQMNVKSQQRTWEEMLRIYERKNSYSLLNHLQVTCRFGNELLASLRAGSVSSPESDELKAVLLEMNQMQPESSLSILPKSRLSSKASLRRPRQTRRTQFKPRLHPYDSDGLYSSDAESLNSKQRQRPGSGHEKNSQNQDASNSAAAGGEQFSPTGAVNWLWICQAEIIPGYFATPWKGLFSEEVCIGAISTILKALDTLTDSSTRRYVKMQRNYQDWIRAGNTTYPSYALNAKGGVVVSGFYKPVVFARFPSHLPPIELLHSYDHQVRRGVRNQNRQPSVIVDDLAELMGLDTWLSLCGRTPPIYDGPNKLLRTLPALAQRILSDFEFEFSNLDRTTSADGGFQLVQTVADSLTAALEEQNLSEPEQLFAMVAFLRAAKTALCVVRGPDTAQLRDVLDHDIQVYLA